MTSWFRADGSKKSVDELTSEQFELLEHIQQMKLFEITKWGTGSDAPFEDERRHVTSLSEANVFSSEIEGLFGASRHYPALDIDMPAFLTPSSSRDHSHLVIRKLMTWQQYAKLLGVLAEVGIIQEGFYKAALRRQATFLRLPWIKKTTGYAGNL